MNSGAALSAPISIPRSPSPQPIIVVTAVMVFQYPDYIDSVPTEDVEIAQSAQAQLTRWFGVNSNK